MVIIVFSHKEQHVHQPHWLPKPWMKRNPFRIAAVQLLHPGDELRPALAEFADQLPDVAPVVPGGAGPGICHVRRSQLQFAGNKIVNSPVVQFIHVDQVANVLLNRPLLRYSRD